MCTHFCERLLQDGVFLYESSLCLVCGLADLALHFDACMQVIRRSLSGRPTLLRLFYVSETRAGECSESELLPPNPCKECNEHEEGVEVLGDVPILCSYTLPNLCRSICCCTDHIDVPTARPLARGAGTQMNWGQGSGPGPPVNPVRGHCGGGRLQCDAFPTVCSPSSPHSAIWLFGEAVDVDWTA